MKSLAVILLFFLPLLSFSQIIAEEFDPQKWEAPYNLNFPKDWGVERFLIPITFAPQIPYKGIEDIRFAPGWGKAEKEDYWSYAFLWYLDGQQKTSAKMVANHLKTYYTGLVAVMIGEDTLGKSIPVKTVIKKVKTQKGDAKTFYGSIDMLDYMAKKPITLNGIVHLKFCSEQNKTVLFYEISPKPYTDKVWQSLNLLWIDFRCEKPVETK